MRPILIALLALAGCTTGSRPGVIPDGGPVDAQPVDAAPVDSFRPVYVQCTTCFVTEIGQCLSAIGRPCECIPACDEHGTEATYDDGAAFPYLCADGTRPHCYRRIN